MRQSPSLSLTGNGGAPALQLTLSSIFINLLALALPVMTLQVYDRILPQEGTGTLTILATGVAVSIALEAILRLSRSWLIDWHGAVYEYKMSCAAMRRVLETDLHDMQRRGPGEYLHQMQAIGRLRDFNNGYAMTAAIDLAFIPVFLFCIVHVAGPLALIPAMGLMFMVLLGLTQGLLLRRRLIDRDRADDKRYNFLIETLGALHTLKALTLEKIFQRRYERLEEVSARANFSTAEATAAVFNGCTVLSHAMVAGIITLGAVLVLKQEITAGALVATLLLAGRMMQMVQRGLVLGVKHQDARLSRDKVARIFDEARPDIIPVTTDNTPPPQGDLRLENVRHILPDGRLLLSIDSFVANTGDCICIKGASGSGKSTLLQIMAGVLPLSSGTVMIDQSPLLRYTAQDLARHIGYINAEPVIFRGSIRQNITRFGDIDALSARRAATQLGIDKDIARLPLGFDTFLQGNISDTIPPGLKQRIAMARVIAATPGILLLDGADMTLDRHGQRLLVDYLRGMRGRITLFIVSDEPAMQALATRTLTLENGTLKEAHPND